MNKEMTFVLVHGAWCGGWWMSRLARELRRRGTEVFAPTLTGLGEREHLASPDVGLNTHIQDILAVLHYEDLHNIVLVGHSYGGVVVTGVADRARDRISRLIYFDAFVLRNGQSLADLFPPELTQTLTDLASREGEGWRTPSPFTMEQFGVTDPELVAWNERGNVMQPLKTMTDPLALSPGPLTFPVSYIYCKLNAMGAFDSSAELAKARGWDYYEAPLTHAGPAVNPKVSADLLMKAAGLN
jgi:pimeloyl-ACP methyl ester carboxylesterase